MPRSRPTTHLAGLAVALMLAVGPALASAALAADPIVTVQRGDTLTAISKRHGISVRTIVELNALPDANRIFAGQQLRIGTDDGAATPSPAQPTAASATTHVVARGENLTRIARHYAVSVAAIVAANGIANPSRIFAGQQLSIPGAPMAPAATPAAAPAQPATPAAAATHVVARGENLTRIARHYAVSVAAIVAANGIANPSRIFAGQQLTIPGAQAALAASPAPAMPASMAALVAGRDAVRVMIAEEANRYGVPVPFALAVAWQESGWRQGVVSSAGAIGIMQLLPATAEWVGGSMLGEPVDINDARYNARAGMRLLAHYLDRYDGNRELVLAAYYQGQSATDRHGVYAISRPYIASILRLERLFGG